MRDGLGDGPSLPLTIATAVDRACERFEAVWDSGGRPRIEDHLGGVDAPGRPHLFRELLTEELRRRTALGETISAEDYHARFPDLAAIVDEIIGPAVGGSRAPVSGELAIFVRRITESGLVSADTLAQFVPPKGHPKDVQDLALQLVRSKQLTRYQAQQIGRNRTRSLLLGNYTILDKIGAGGMGQVFRAQHRRMERVVAIKMLPPETVKDPSAVARFQREVIAAAKLRHPNIVAADDADEADGVHFLVMEYVDGRDLAAVIKGGGSLPVVTAVGYVIQAARGLEFAHRRGVVHRDIKPSNLLLDREGTVKVLDMGLARLSGEGDAATLAELTGTGAVMGTIDYMAPEQAVSSRHADARADVYSLGCTLHYLLTGRPPYAGDTLMARLIAHREAPIPRLGDGVPAPVRAAFERMVAKRPEDRFQTMAEVIAALERYHNGLERTLVDPASPLTATDAGASTLLSCIAMDSASENEAISFQPDPAPPRRDRRLLTAGAAALLGLVVIAGLVVTLRTPEGTLVAEIDQPDARVQVLDAAGKVEITQPGEAGHVSISVAPGKHKLRVEKEGFVVYTSDAVVIESRGTKPIRVHLEPLRAKVPEARPASSAARVSEAPAFEAWMKGVAALSPEKQLEAVKAKLKELNPGYGGEGRWTIGPDGSIELRELPGDRVSDFSPLRAVRLDVLALDPAHPGKPDLTTLAGLRLGRLEYCDAGAVDLSPLKGMPLHTLLFYGNRVTDLSPLKGMPLGALHLDRARRLSDLGPLRGMPLGGLYLSGTRVSDLSPLKGMSLGNLYCETTLVSDLSPLAGMKLGDFRCAVTPVADLSPLAGMPLENLHCNFTRVTDLSPLAGMKLKTLTFTPAQITRGIEAVRQMDSLTGIGVTSHNLMTPKVFWEHYDRGDFGRPGDWASAPPAPVDPAFRAWMDEVATLPAERQVEVVQKKLVELNPGYAGDGKWSFMDGEAVGLSVWSDRLSDLSPLQALPEVGLLWLYAAGGHPDLARLPRLGLLVCWNGNLTDLSPLRGRSINTLDISNNRISDLSPLKGMPLDVISCPSNPLTDLAPLRGMGLVSLNIEDTNVSDLSPLAGMKLKTLSFTPVKIIRGIEVIRRMESLQQIGPNRQQLVAPREFWERYDRGEFGKP